MTYVQRPGSDVRRRRRSSRQRCSYNFVEAVHYRGFPEAPVRDHTHHHARRGRRRLVITRRRFLIAGPGAIAAVTAACGGGGDGGSTAAPPVPGPTPPAPDPTPPAPTPPEPVPPVAPPPVVPGGEDPLLIYDRTGGITDTHVYSRLIAWKNRGGDWLDANGVAQGPKPFGEAVLGTGQSGRTSIDVTPLVVQGSEPSLVLRAIANSGMAPLFRVAARESGTGAAILVVHTDGSSESLPVAYDAECNTTTAYELGGNPSMTVGGSSAYLRFPAPVKPVRQAKLVLDATVNTGGKLVVYKFAVHRDPKPADTLTLKGDPRVFFETECFDDAPYYIRTRIFGGPPPAIPDEWNQRAVVGVEGGRALQVTFDPRGSSALSASVCFPNFDEADEAAWEFDIRLMPDLLTGLADGIKLFAGCSSSTKNDDAYFAGWAGTNTPGRCGTLLAGNGGSKAHGNDGWSLRWDSWNSPPAPHPLHGRFLPMQYAYWPEQADYYGDPWSWNLQHTSLEVGRWYTITQRCKVNTCAGTAYAKDAEFDGYIDHRLALRRRGFYLRTTDTPLIALPPYNVRSKLAIGRIWLNSYHGGTSVPKARCSFQVRNFRVARLA